VSNCDDLGRFKYRYGEVESSAHWVWVVDPSTEYHFLGVMDWVDACGRDAEDLPTYHVDVQIVRLDLIPLETWYSALECCGQLERYQRREKDEGFRSLANAWFLAASALKDYGTSMRAYGESTNNWRKGVAEAKRASLARAGDNSLLHETCNKLGQTWGEHLTGRMGPALKRLSHSDDGKDRMTAGILAKMYAASDGQTLGGHIDQRGDNVMEVAAEILPHQLEMEFT